MSSTFPAATAITIQVACGGQSGKSGRHPVTVRPDWSVETGHDLELERIAAAFGSRTACVDLADRRLPCLRQLWLHRQRVAPPGIKRTRDGHWEVVSPVHGCGCVPREAGWQRPEEAAAHLRTLHHWARAFGADVGACNRLIVSIERATGGVFDGLRRTWPRSAAVSHHTDLAWLWDVGLDPDDVERMHSGLRLGEPMAAIGYLYVASSGAPLEELAPYATDGAEAVCWAASSWLEHGEVTPAERREWYLTGLHWRLISALIAGPYTLADVRMVAASTGKSLNSAAEVLRDWRAAACEPTVAQVIQCCAFVPHGRQAPSIGAVDAVWAAAGRQRLSRTEIALVLVVAGTPTTAKALIGRGISTFRDAAADMAQTRQ